AFPLSTKGSRVLNDQTQSWYHLTVFQNRITEILTQDKQDADSVRQKRPILEFSPEAKIYWFKFHNNIELDLNAGKYLSDIDDFASKITSNLARIAALFHYFEGEEGDISADTGYLAGTICDWYIREFKRLFTKNPAIPIEVSDATELELWLVKYCQTNFTILTLPKSKITQFGPPQLRTNKFRREAAVNSLVVQNKIRIQLYGKMQLIILNPNFFPILRSNEGLFTMPPYLPTNTNF
ncbi:MAG: DUF3987 domain-containing protein, partial [bacterium]|nr:DUF3987 domain-containing protein [bacterium]